MRRALPTQESIRANMTPMIDVVFLLIIFFMLVAQMSRERTITLELPSFENRQSLPLTANSQLVINVDPGVDGAAVYRIGQLSFTDEAGDRARLTQVLRRAQRRMPSIQVLIRADRLEHYERVHPLMDIVAEAGIREVGLVTIPLE